MSSLYERIGGKAAINATVDIFYLKVVTDDRLKHFFKGTDMYNLVTHQKKFLTYAFGGTGSYSCKEMKEAHKKLVEEMGLTDAHFDAVIENLGETLAELNVPEDLIAEAAEIAESTREIILNRS